MCELETAKLRDWTMNEITMIPDVMGVFLLRDKNQNIVFVGRCDDTPLGTRLRQSFMRMEFPSVTCFQWAALPTAREVNMKFAKLLSEYWPEGNRTLMAA